MSIKHLSPEVIDQIAAGEVVERPAHLVKEILENSLDAGAKKVSIEYDFGGRFVKVSDDGRGMDKSDLGKCLDRYATSKISNTEDLWRLSSFGFRGEALASISAVSRMTIVTKTSVTPLGSQMISHFGRQSEIEEISAAQGTTVVVEDLFANTPARLKFLKSEASEHNQIKNVIKAMALSHPEVEFKVISKSKLLYYWPSAENKLERAKQVLEAKTLFEGVAERGRVKAYAVFTSPLETQNTSKNIWIFAQNRWIQDRSLQAAVLEAHRNLLMHGEYPLVVSWVETHPEEIDVNIHPTKSQVKFQDASNAFRAVQAAVRDTLEKAPWTTQLVRAEGKVQTPDWVQVPLEASEVPMLHQTFYAKKESFSSFSGEESILETLKKMAPSKASLGTTPEPLKPSANSEPTVWKWKNLDVIGQAHLTYIVAQSAQSLFFVDQHAAHERIVFEKLMMNYRQKNLQVQDYLIPHECVFSEEACEVLIARAQEFEALGLRFERLGPTILGISAAPVLIKAQVWPTLLEKIAQDILDKGESFVLDKKVADIFATMACHSVIRAGDPLSVERMKQLLEEMDLFPLSTFCPHGRPVFVEYPRIKLEREFGRIV